MSHLGFFLVKLVHKASRKRGGNASMAIHGKQGSVIAITVEGVRFVLNVLRHLIVLNQQNTYSKINSIDNRLADNGLV